MTHFGHRIVESKSDSDLSLGTVFRIVDDKDEIFEVPSVWDTLVKIPSRVVPISTVTEVPIPLHG